MTAKINDPKCQKCRINDRKPCKRFDKIFHSSLCRECYNQKQVEKIKNATPEQKLNIQNYHRKYRKDNFELIARNKREERYRAKQEGIEEYGGRCTCCGESRIEFLTIEHKYGRIKGEKKRTGKDMWLKLKWAKWPKDQYTILCFNCNSSRGAFGYCPHERERTNESNTKN